MRLLIKKRSQFPKCVRYFAVLKGICVGECVNKSSTISTEDVPAVGHAHADITDPYHGWVCLQYKCQLKEKYTLLHEVAHLIANRYNNTPDHGKKWRKTVVEIGGTFKPYRTYNKKGIYRDFSHADPVRKV